LANGAIGFSFRGMNRRLPVTLIGGFLGAGKTSLLHHLISEHQGGHLAILVGSPSDLNFDARALCGLCGAMRRQHDTVLEIPAKENIEWIAARLREFAEAGRYERVLIEVSGRSSSAGLGRYFGFEPIPVQTFTPWAELRQIVGVIDALDFYRTTIADPMEGMEERQQSHIWSANLLVLNKCDLIGDAERKACTQQLRKLNPDARIIETDYGEVPAEAWSNLPPLKTQLYPPSNLTIEARAQQVSQNVSLVTYRAHRPFHPQRFWDWFNADHPGLVRMKGLIWLATRNLLVGGVSRTRWENSCGAAGIWWAALPREEWPEEPEALAQMQETWREPYGDRRQELLLIYDPVSKGTRNKLQLDDCLLTPEEMARPVAEWANFPDPFPEWDMGE
jgi:G3E family GTPase